MTPFVASVLYLTGAQLYAVYYVVRFGPSFPEHMPRWERLVSAPCMILAAAYFWPLFIAYECKLRFDFWRWRRRVNRDRGVSRAHGQSKGCSDNQDR